MGAQKINLMGAIHALGHGTQLEAAGQRNDRADDRLVARILADADHKGPVNLERVDGQQFQVSERRIAGAEVIHCELYADLVEFFEDSQGVLNIHNHRFGDFKLQSGGFKPGFVENGAHDLNDIAALNLFDRQVDRHLGQHQTGGAPRHDLPTGPAQHPFAQFDDETGFFGQRDKAYRRHGPQFGAGPAQQRFRARGPAFDINLKLIMQAKFIGLDRPA